MILKTFDSKIDKWTSKIGIFGKSFNEIGTAINIAFKEFIDNIDNFDEDVSFWECLKNNLFNRKEDKAWIKNSIGEIISKENIDSYINELDLDSAKEKISEIFNWDTSIKNDETTWEKFFDTCKGGNEYLIDLIKNTDDLSKLTSEDLVKANQAARDSALAHNEALKAQTLSAKAGTVALKSLAIVGNMAFTFVATKLIGSFVNFIDNLHTTLKEQQEITQNLQGELSEIQSDISDVNSELQTTSDRIDELSKKDSLSFVEKEELENLTAQNEELERRNRLLKEQEAAKQQEVAESVQREFNKEYGNRTYHRIVSQQQIDEIAEKRARYNELYISNTAIIPKNNKPIYIQIQK